MADSDYKTLLKELPEIAEAVNAFKTEACQLEVLRALLSSVGASSVPESPAAVSPRKTSAAPKVAKKDKAETKAKKGSKRSSTVRAPQIVGDLNLRPKGKPSLQEFIAEKRPPSQPDQVVVMVYYMTSVLEIGAVTQDHLYTCFRTVPGLRVPTDVWQSVRNTSQRKGWVTCNDRNDIRLNAAGLNHVEHDLPPKATDNE